MTYENEPDYTTVRRERDPRWSPIVGDLIYAALTELLPSPIQRMAAAELELENARLKLIPDRATGYTVDCVSLPSEPRTRPASPKPRKATK
jgi:hypothetical protein